MRLVRYLVPIGVAVALIGGSCNTGSSTTEPAASPTATGSVEEPLEGTVPVTIDKFATSPQTMVVKVGTTLEVTNNDVAGHSLTAIDGSFDSGVLGKGQSKTLTMDKAGTFAFRCTPHPSTSDLQGTITVVE